MKSERLAAIRQHLISLGPITGWRSTVDGDSGELVLHLPPQFCWENNQLVLGDMEAAAPASPALLMFLGDAPHAITDLLAEIERLKAMLDQPVITELHIIAARQRVAIAEAAGAQQDFSDALLASPDLTPAMVREWLKARVQVNWCACPTTDDTAHIVCATCGLPPYWTKKEPAP